MSDTEPLPVQQPYGQPPHGPGPAPGPGHPGNAPGPAQGYPANVPGPGHEYPGPNGPAPGHPGNGPGPAQGYPARGPAPRRERPSDGSDMRRAALVVHSVADVAAAFLGLWVVLYLLGANLGNPFVVFVQGIAEWLGWWAQDIFTMENEGVRVFLNYGLPAVIYLFVGHSISRWIRRL